MGLSAAAALKGFGRERFSSRGAERDLYRAGTGPAVVVIAEIPGITPAVADFGRRVAEIGCTAVLPDLFGEAGVEPSPARMATTLGRACISREFTTLALRRTSPVTTWLRALAGEEHRRCGGPGVGVVGMCLTGGFALAMAVDDTVVAPVLSQPGLPFPVSSAHRADVGVSDADLASVRARCGDDDGPEVLGLRFSEDRLCPPERFDSLRRALGDRFLAVEIDSSPGNPHGIGRGAHSVLTEELVDVPSHPTYHAMGRVLDLLRRRLLT